MKKITPDPPSSNSPPSENLTSSEAAQRARTHFQNHSQPRGKLVNSLPESLFITRPNLSVEEALTTAYEVLEAAIATAYQSAEHQDGSSRQLALAVVHLTEMAHTLVASALDQRWVAAADS
ncbi:DUF6124 family protein [Pseudomonas sp. NA-150]|uniref:DUF6124 family protein n=1 Tax=Pseudomonas sp. NA-150 TaxID=3367525 RepID=UPI0037CC455D